MLKHRIIPVVLWDGQQAVQTTRFDKWRRIGSFQQIISTYEARNVDELVILDIAATRLGKGFNFDAMRDFAANLSMPLTMGGGVANIVDATNLIRHCCEKVVIKSGIRGFYGAPLIRDIAAVHGSQAVVVAADVSDNRIFLPKRRIKNPAKDKFQFTIEGFIKRIEEQGAGEILLTSVERQGTMTGYDLKLIERAVKAATIPIVANGGCGCYEHMAQALNAGANAVAASTIFAFTDATPSGAAEYLDALGYAVRVGS